eukprot:357715-Chlamydomonas_euryale.AAC.11
MPPHSACEKGACWAPTPCRAQAAAGAALAPHSRSLRPDMSATRHGIQPKILQYEAFLNETLKPDLQRANEATARLEAEAVEYDALEANLRMLKERDSENKGAGGSACARHIARAHQHRARLPPRVHAGGGAARDPAAPQGRAGQGGGFAATECKDPCAHPTGGGGAEGADALVVTQGMKFAYVRLKAVRLPAYGKYPHARRSFGSLHVGMACETNKPWYGSMRWSAAAFRALWRWRLWTSAGA